MTASPMAKVLRTGFETIRIPLFWFLRPTVSGLQKILPEQRRSGRQPRILAFRKKDRLSWI
jgi:hypothetical protein